jgi:hypothetical protein
MEAVAENSLFEAEAPPVTPEDPEEIRVPEHTRRKGGRRRPPKHLPRERIGHDLPEEEKRCACGVGRDDLSGPVGARADGRAKSWLWECVSGAGPPIVRMYYSPSRAGAVVVELLDGFSGYLQTDGYSAYDAAMKNSPPAAAQVARQALVLIGELYDIDQRAMNKPLDERHAHRQQHVAPHIDRIRAWLDAHAAFGLGHGGLSTTAFTYLYNQWEKLVRFLGDPRLRLDNNLAERHIVPSVQAIAVRSAH